MAILIDPPRWPAHGTRFAHLASDLSLAELHTFARANAVPQRAFDHDHYDVPETRTQDLVTAGARPVESRELVSRLSAAGLRVRASDRAPRRSRAITELTRSWAELMPQAPALGADLLRRWQEPQRQYHDVRHLFQMLSALQLISGPAVPPAVALAAWFHDAVYAGVPGQDERASAELARAELAAARAPSHLIDEVFRLVLLTIDHNPDRADQPGVLLVDADLSILGQVPGRYHLYVRDVRLEHPELTDIEFGMARLAVVRALLSVEMLFRSGPGRHLWLNQARENLAGEVIHWTAVRGHHNLEEQPNR